MNLVNSIKFLNSISDYVLVVDYKYRILYINNSLSNKIGYKNDEIEMLNVFKTLFKEEWRAQSIFSELINNEEKELPVNIYTKYEEKIKLAVKVIKNCWQDEEAYYIICKEKNTEEQEELSKEIKRLVDNVPYYLWANDKEGKILFANKSFAEFFSRDKEELYGKTYIDLLSMDTGIKMMNSDKKIMEGKKAKFFTQELKVGEKKHCFEHYKMPMINGNNDVMGVMGVSRDISVMNTLKKFNSEWENVLGWSNDEIFINGMFGTIYEEDKEVLINAFKEKKDLCEQSVRHICKDGTYRWISWKLKYVQSRNVFVATGRDLTESIKMREKTKELEKAVEIESIRNEFFANISHEFKTPLNIILTTMQLIVQNIYAGKIAADESVDLAKYTKAIKQNSLIH